MYDINRAEKERSKIVVKAMQTWKKDFGKRKTNKLAKQIIEAINVQMPMDDLYGENSLQYRDLSRLVAGVIGVSVDRRKRNNIENADRVDEVVDSSWYYTLAIREISKANPEFTWGFTWSSRCNERRGGKFACQRLDGKKWKLGNKTNTCERHRNRMQLFTIWSIQE